MIIDTPIIVENEAQLTLISVLASLLAVTIFFNVFWTRLLRPRWEAIVPFPGVPSLPGRHWFFGHGFRLIDKSTDFLTYQHDVYEKHADGNGRTGFWVLQTKGIVLTHARDVLTVLRQESHKSAPPLVVHHLSKLLGPEQLGLLNGAKWKAHRSAITKSFNPSSLRALRTAVLDVLDTVTKTIQNRIELSEKRSYELDIELLMKIIGIDALGLSSFSHRFGCSDQLQLHEFAQSFSFVMSDVFRRIEDSPFDPRSFLYFLPSQSNREFERHRRRIRDLILSFIQEHRQRLSSDPANKPRDLLDNLLIAHDSAKDKASTGRISESTLVDVTMTILFAGYDTVSNTMTYALYLISTHAHVQANMLRETRKHGTNHPESLVYTKAVFMEALRLFPPGAVGNFRNLTRSVQLPGKVPLVLPKGTLVLLPFWSIHHNPENFVDPEDFVPERWVWQNDKGEWRERSVHPEVPRHTSIPAAHPSHFFGFSAGGRNCPGGKYATLEAVLVLATLVSRFEWELVDPNYQVIPERRGPVQHPLGGIPMRVRIRPKR